VPAFGVGVSILSWDLLVVAVVAILSKCDSLRHLERFASRHHGVLTEALKIELMRSSSDHAFRYFFLQVNVVAVCAASRNRTIKKILSGKPDLHQLMYKGKTLRGSIEPTADRDSAYGHQTTSTKHRSRSTPQQWA